jgi:hypothetical protein
MLQARNAIEIERVKAPTPKELNTLVHKISQRVARFLTKQGLLVEDIENSYLNFDELAPEPIQDLLGHSITYRIAMAVLALVVVMFKK